MERENREKPKTAYLLGGLFIFLISLFLNTYVAIVVFELKGKIEDFYQKDFVDVRVVSEQLVRDIEEAYGKKLPPVELNIRLSDYSKIGIQYENNTNILKIYLPPKIISFDNKQKRAYLAHEFGHYVLRHTTDQKDFSTYSFFGTGDLKSDILADSFALRFSSVEDLSSVIKEMVWDENQKKMRISATGGM